MTHARLWSTYETKPAGEDNANQGDDEIRSTKVDIRERMAIDHEWNVSTAADGRHLKCTLKTGTAPTQVADYVIIYGKDVSAKCELFAIDEDGDEVQITSGGTLNLATAMLLTGAQEAAGVKTFHDQAVFEAGAAMSNQQVSGLLLENRTNDTGCTQTGRIWYRTDV